MVSRTAPRIAIPIPHSGNADYAGRALPQYELAVSQAGGEPVRIPLDQNSHEAMKLIESCGAVLLPGSEADVDPAKYKALRHPKTAAADVKRDVVDEWLLEDAFKTRKPIFGICYGLQILNVHCGGSLVQHIESKINHEAGRKVPIAHEVSVEPASLLGGIVAGAGGNLARLPVNSSHHQSADVAGSGLRIVSHSTEDWIVEAIEGTNPDHFVLAVQWHPERSVELDEPSRALFQAFVKAAKAREAKLASHARPT
jgi:putative glutamine amidotransferase